MDFKAIGKKVLPLALAAALGVQPAAASVYKLSVPDGYQSPFTDVQSGDWYYKYVAVLNSRGMIDGYGDGTFGPNDALTSGAALVMVLKAAGSGTLSATGEHWASGYADYAVEKGYLTREEIGDLDQPIRRELIAHLAAKALDLEPSQASSPFADAEDGYLTALYEMGIITGSTEDGETVFLPDQSITRAEISVIVWQVERVHKYGEQVLFQGSYYDVESGVPVNSYDPEGFYRNNGIMTYQEDGVTVQRGIDVSVHQGSIDWQKVADAGIDFAMLRVGYRGYGSEGKMMPDKYFTQNIEGATAAGLEVGIYYFSQAVTEEEARQEAQYVLDQIKYYKIAYPVVYDWERQNYSGSRTQTVPDSTTMTKLIRAFCGEIEAAGYEPMVYFYQSLAYNNLDLSAISDYPFWLAQYTDYPSFYYDFDMWQYTSSGKVSGISGSVDLNLRFFRGDEWAEHQAKVASLPEPEPKPTESSGESTASGDSSAQTSGNAQTENAEQESSSTETESTAPSQDMPKT